MNGRGRETTAERWGREEYIYATMGHFKAGRRSFLVVEGDPGCPVVDEIVRQDLLVEERATERAI